MDKISADRQAGYGGPLEIVFALPSSLAAWEIAEDIAARHGGMIEGTGYLVLPVGRSGDAGVTEAFQAGFVPALSWRGW